MEPESKTNPQPMAGNAPQEKRIWTPPTIELISTAIVRGGPLYHYHETFSIPPHIVLHHAGTLS
ncbi:MAG: hypothetical protein ACXVJD_16205 [Mucilaginibacter sp.]